MKRVLLLSTALVMIFTFIRAQDTQEKSAPALPSSQNIVAPDSSHPAAQTLRDVLFRSVIPATRKKPLVIVDDVAANDPMPVGTPDPLDTKVNDIQSILVVKDPSELAAYATLYGPGVANGLILISSKRQAKK